MAQTNRNLRLTHDGRMQSTMKNLTVLARHVRCAITRKACVNGVHRLGFGVHLSNLPMHVGVLGVEANFERLETRVALAISPNNHNRWCGTCNMPLTTRRDKAQCNVKRHAGCN